MAVWAGQNAKAGSGDWAADEEAGEPSERPGDYWANGMRMTCFGGTARCGRWDAWEGPGRKCGDPEHTPLRAMRASLAGDVTRASQDGRCDGRSESQSGGRNGSWLGIITATCSPR